MMLDRLLVLDRVCVASILRSRNLRKVEMSGGELCSAEELLSVTSKQEGCDELLEACTVAGLDPSNMLGELALEQD